MLCQCIALVANIKQRKSPDQAKREEKGGENGWDFRLKAAVLFMEDSRLSSLVGYSMSHSKTKQKLLGQYTVQCLLTHHVLWLSWFIKQFLCINQGFTIFLWLARFSFGSLFHTVNETFNVYFVSRHTLNIVCSWMAFRSGNYWCYSFLPNALFCWRFICIVWLMTNCQGYAFYK